nr:hypothetical protein [Tanacetum cinerariifolium]
MCGIKASAEQKQKLEEMMLELLELCREKEFYCVHDNIEDLIGMAMNTMLLSINLKSQRLDKEKQEVKNIVEQATKGRTQITESLQNFTIIHKMSSISNTPQISLVIAITPDLPTEEPNNSLSMGDEHLSTIPEIESDEEIKSSVKNLVPIPKIISTKIEEADFDLEEEICLVENLPYDNSLPRPPEELNAEIADTILGPLSPSPIPVEDKSEGDIHFLEELFSNDPLPLPENESSNFDHHDDPSFPRPPPKPPDVEVFFDFEPDTGVLTTKVVKGISENYVLMPNILPTLPTLDPDLDFTHSHDSLGSRNKIFNPRIFIEVQSERLLSQEEFSISFIHDPLYPVFDTLPPLSSENEDKVFKPGLLSNNSLSFPENESFHFDIPSSSFPRAKSPNDDEIKLNLGILTVKMVGDI